MRWEGAITTRRKKNVRSLHSLHCWLCVVVVVGPQTFPKRKEANSGSQTNNKSNWPKRHDGGRQSWAVEQRCVDAARSVSVVVVVVAVQVVVSEVVQACVGCFLLPFFVFFILFLLVLT